MVYGYDQAIQLPVRDLYDSGIMLMALGVAKDMYEKGEKRINDFYTKYGDFITPIQKDQDYYNRNVIDAVRNSINSLYANGGDPLRNVQSRAELARVIRNIPYGEINKLRASAKNAEQYLKAKSQLLADGLWNSDYEDYLLGGRGLDSWSTAEGDGIWDRMSPGKYSDLNAATHPWFDNVNRNAYLYTKDGYDYFGVKPEDLKTVMNSNIPDFVNSDYGRYQMELARRALGPNASNAEVMEKLKQNILDANRELTINPTRSMNKIAELELQDRYAARQAARRHAYDIALARLKGEIQNDPSGGLTPYTRQIQDAANQRVLDQMGAGRDPNMKNRANMFLTILDFYKKKLDGVVQKKGADVLTGTKTTIGNLFFNTSITGLPYAETTIPIKNNEPVMSKQYSGGNDKLYKYYKDKIDKYQSIVDGTYKILSKVEEDRLNALYKKEQNGLTDHEKRAKAVLEQKYTKTQQKLLNEFRDDFMRAFGNEEKSGQDRFSKANDEFYSMFQFTPTDKAGHDAALGVFTNFADRKKFKSLPGEYHVVNFGREGMQFSRIRKADVSGPRRYTYNALSNKFSRWLTNGTVEGVMFDEGVSWASIPRAYSSFGETLLDVEGNPAITKEDMMRFVNTLPSNLKSMDVGEIARLLGLRPIDREGTILTDEEDSYRKATYYQVPTIKTTTNRNSFAFSQIDNSYNELKFGKEKAYANAINNEASSLSPIILPKQQKYEQEE